MTTGDQDRWKLHKAREEAFDVKVKAALDDIKPVAIEATGIQKIWFSHFGATGIDPKHLFIFAILPKRSDVDACKASNGWKRIQEALFERLRAHGYPVESLDENQACLLFSQQECDEEANGNWYYFFK